MIGWSRLLLLGGLLFMVFLFDVVVLELVHLLSVVAEGGRFQ